MCTRAHAISAWSRPAQAWKVVRVLTNLVKQLVHSRDAHEEPLELGEKGKENMPQDQVK